MSRASSPPRRCTPLSPAGWGLLLWLVGVAPAQAGSLWITGPDGAAVVVDGDHRGELPLSAPLVLGEGNHRVRCQLAGYVAYEETLYFWPDQQMEMAVELLPLRRREAVAFSLLAAGAGQHYLGRPVRGWVMLGLEAGALAGALVFDSRMKTKREDHVEALQAYQSAVAEEDIVAARAEAEDAFDAMDSAQTLRNVSIVAALGFAVVSAIDAWFLYDRVVIEEPTLDLDPRDGGEVSVSWSVRF